MKTTGERHTAVSARLWALAALGTVLLMVLLLLLRDPRYFFYGDTQAAYYGWWYHLGEQVRAGHWPVLDPHAWRAGNLVAEGQWGLYSPLSIGIGLLATVSGGVLLLASAVKVALICAGSLGMFALVRSYDGPPPMACFAAVAVPMGGMTQYLDMPSWAAGLTIWALFPWVWWALRGAMRRPAMVAPALVAGYLMVTVGYVYGTIMLILVLVGCLTDAWIARDRTAAARLFGVGLVCGLVAVAVYLPGVLTASVSVRDSAFGGFGGKFSTDPLAMFMSVIPTAAVPDTSAHLLPYAYLAWFLPVLLWLDVEKVRRGWRPLTGLLLITVVTLLVVDGPARFGPLRWPLRLQTFLVVAVVLAVVVALTRFGVRRPSSGRLVLSLLWVFVAGVVAVVRAPGVWPGHLLSVVLVGAGLIALWYVARRSDSHVWLAGVGCVVTLAATAWQHTVFPEPPSPQRNMPASLAAYQRPLAQAEGDVMVVGDASAVVEAHPAAVKDLLVGSAWYLNGQRVQNTYTAVSHAAFKDRYCMTYQGSTCPEALGTLFAREPDTGRRRVDLLGVSTLLLVRADFPPHVLDSPPSGWRRVGTTPWSVTWVRENPVPGAGRPVWTSPGTAVTPLSTDDRTARFRVQDVPSGGGRVVLSALAWPGYTTDVGRLADPADGYLLEVDVPGDARGQVVTVHFSPPAWPLELACWWLGLGISVVWPLGAYLRRRRGSRSAEISAAARSTASRRARTDARTGPSGDGPTIRT